MKVIMGKGDKKTKRGKIIMGSYGKKRPRKVGNKIVVSVEKSKKAKKTDTVKNKLNQKIEVPVEKVELKEEKIVVDNKPVEEKKETVKKTTTKKTTTKKTTTAKKTTTKKTEEKPKTKVKKASDK